MEEIIGKDAHPQPSPIGLKPLKIGFSQAVAFLSSFHESTWKIFYKLRLPKSLPYLFRGFKISITLAFVGAIVDEFVGGKNGLGYLIVVSNSDLNTPLMFVALVLSAAMGLAYFEIIALLERLLLPWYIARMEAMIKGYL